jgi:hypothetical protein
MIWGVSILIIIFTSVSVSPEFRYKIRQFIGDDTSNYYSETIDIFAPDSTSSDILKHTIVEISDHWIGYSKQMRKMIKLNSRAKLDQYVNSQTQNCSSCHQKIQGFP